MQLFALLSWLQPVLLLLVTLVGEKWEASLDRAMVGGVWEANTDQVMGWMEWDLLTARAVLEACMDQATVGAELLGEARMGMHLTRPAYLAVMSIISTEAVSIKTSQISWGVHRLHELTHFVR